MKGRRILLIVVSSIIIFSVILVATENNVVQEEFSFEITPINRTDGTVDFQVTTNSYNGAYAPAHCLAIWVCDENDDFKITLVRRAWFYIQHLVKWNQMTNGDDTNALITGASPNVHTTWTLNWDCRDRFGEMIPDGDYRVYVEFTEDNSLLIPVNGPWTMVEFTKGDQAETITLPGDQFFQDLSLEYTPLSSAQDDLHLVFKELDNFPNPFNPTTTISYQVSGVSGQEDLELRIYNIKGQKIKKFDLICHPEFIEGSTDHDTASSPSTGLRMTRAGSSYAITWNGTDDTGQIVPSGVYFYKLKSGKYEQTRKMLLLK